MYCNEQNGDYEFEKIESKHLFFYIFDFIAYNFNGATNNLQHGL